MTKTNIHSIVLAACLLLVPGSLIAQEKAADAPAKNQQLDLSVPESPAFTVLNLTPQTVVRPSTPRSLAATLLNGVDAQGNFQSGIALDTVPYLLFSGNSFTIKQYRASRMTRFFSNIQTSFATTKGASDDDKSLRLALGFRFTLFDKGDPRMFKDEKGDFFLDKRFLAAATIRREVQRTRPKDITELTKEEQADVDAQPEENRLLREREIRRNKIEGALKSPLITPNWDQLSQQEKDAKINAALEENLARSQAVDSKVQEEIAKVTRNAFDQLRKLTWNRSSWIVAAAPSWISPAGSTAGLRSSGGGIWTSYAYGFEGIPGLERTSQLILHLRYRFNEQVADPTGNGMFYEQNSLFVGTRLRLGGPDSALNLEASYIHADPISRSTEDYYRLSVGTELKLAKDQYLTLSFGGEGGRANGQNTVFALAAFKFGSGGSPSLISP